MKIVTSVLLAVLLHLTGRMDAAESTVDFGSFVLKLPDGYTDRPGHGIDSRVGEITIAGKPFKILYDDISWGPDSAERMPTKLSEFSKEPLDSLLYFERLQDEPFSMYITAWYHPSDPSHRRPIVSLDVLGVGASFSVQVESRAAVRDAVEAMRAIKVAKPRKTAR